MVLVHDVVAHLNLVQLLERQGQLARAGAVALEIVFVESVEDLMVGKHTESQVIVDKPLVQRAQAWLKPDVVLAVVEDGTQAGYLLLVVAQDQYLVAP